GWRRAMRWGTPTSRARRATGLHADSGRGRDPPRQTAVRVFGSPRRRRPDGCPSRRALDAFPRAAGRTAGRHGQIQQVTTESASCARGVRRRRVYFGGLMTRRLVGIVAALALAGSVAFAQAPQTSATDPSTVTTTGESAASVPPDVAFIQIAAEG